VRRWYGGTIESDGTLTDTGAYFTGSYASYFGSAVFNDDDGTVSGSTFQKNSTGFANAGGAIDNEGDMQLACSTFTGNTGEYGGAVYNDADMTMTRDSRTGNTAYNGDGIDNDYDGDLTIYGSLIDFNRASDEGGGIFNWECGSFTVTHPASYGNVPSNISANSAASGSTTAERQRTRFTPAGRPGID
jgi:hypothetical protein